MIPAVQFLLPFLLRLPTQTFFSPYKKKLDQDISNLKAQRDSLVIDKEKLESDIKNLERTKNIWESAVSQLKPDTRKQVIETAVEENPDTAQIASRIYIPIWSNEQRNKLKQLLRNYLKPVALSQVYNECPTNGYSFL